jgi:hypothetical protein
MLGAIFLLPISFRQLGVEHFVSTKGLWVAKSLGISTAIALITCVGFYLFFHIHQELEIQPVYAFRLATVAFVLSAIVTMIYFRVRAGR